MRCFGLTPDQVLAREPAAKINPPPSLFFSILYGAFTFGAISVVAYSIWAYRLIEGTAAMYSSIAAVYVGLIGLALSRLVVGPGVWIRFALLFAAAFSMYALAWCAFWFGLKGKHHADLWGSAVGLAAMTWLIRSAFGKPNEFLPLFAVLFTFHTLGYFLGDALHASFRGPAGRLQWGAAYGLGFGAGVGYVLLRCQTPLIRLLEKKETATGP